MVASFTDAWIETLRKWKNPDKHLVASFTDAWIETIGEDYLLHPLQSHLLQMRGLKQAIIFIYLILLCRIFYRCVD